MKMHEAGKNNKEQTGSIWIQVQRQPFEGMEGRDDGLGRGEGQTTLLQEEGADEDDDGEIDGRLHVEAACEKFLFSSKPGK